MVALKEQIEAAVRDRRLFHAGQSILVAVSGGVDSMVLLDILRELSNAWRWRLTVAHLNHQLRGSSSLADERLVRRVARQLKLPILVSRANVHTFAKTHSISTEMAARQLRHDFLARAALSHKIRAVALAHHLDDQVELFFLRLFRGAGGRGLAGMKWTNPSPIISGIQLVRPLLSCSKAALREYARTRRIPFREDATNANLDIQRNRIRHELLPLLARHYQPAVGDNIVRTMDLLAAESEFLDEVTESWLSGRRKVRSNAAFATLPIALQRRCIQLQLIRLGIAPDFDLVEHLRVQPGKPIALPGSSPASTFCAVMGPKGTITINRSTRVGFLPGCRELDLASGGQIDWAGVRLTWRILARNGAKLPAHRSGSEFFDADAVGEGIIVRHWRPGDRFQPIGQFRPAKLQDLFMNQKVPRARRHKLVVATTLEGELFWVESLRISERFKLTNGTIRRLHWAWQKL